MNGGLPRLSDVHSCDVVEHQQKFGSGATLGGVRFTCGFRHQQHRLSDHGRQVCRVREAFSTARCRIGRHFVRRIARALDSLLEFSSDTSVRGLSSEGPAKFGADPCIRRVDATVGRCRQCGNPEIGPGICRFFTLHAPAARRPLFAGRSPSAFGCLNSRPVRGH